MGFNSKIIWTDHTFSPWWGCQKVGPGCDNCYAETLDKRTGGAHWGSGAARRRTSVHNWNDPIRWNKKKFFVCQGCGRRGTEAELLSTDESECDCWKYMVPARRRVFCASMADVFDNEADPQWRVDLFRLIAATPNLDYLLLTKRIGNVMTMLPSDWVLAGQPPHNVWLGATICNQPEADRDIPKLLAVPAAKRFLSMEPLLGPVDLLPWFAHEYDGRPGSGEVCSVCGVLTNGKHHPYAIGVDWVIVGGESGPKARPMHPDWARCLRDQCQAASVPYFFKQWGEWTPGENVERQRGTVDTAFLWSDEWIIQPLNLATDGGHVDDEPDLYRVGKKAAGRHLDGREWSEVPG